jgi:hypothetical protein
MIQRLLLMALTACLPALGQAQDATLSGRIREPGGNAVPSLRVALVPLNGNVRKCVVTNEFGVFDFREVPPGRYTVFAPALTAALPPGTADVSSAVVVSTTVCPPLFRLGSGTFFPGTADASQASAITVDAGSSIENVDFTLAEGVSDPSLRAVRGRIVVEGGGTPAMKSDQFSLFFSDGPDNRASDVTFMDGPRRPATTSTRLEAASGFEMITSIVPMPAFPEGSFTVFVRDGAYRVIQPAPTADSGPGHTAGTHYVRALSFGDVDLKKELMTVQGSPADELVITLAACSEATDDPLCR